MSDELKKGIEAIFAEKAAEDEKRKKLIDESIAAAEAFTEKFEQLKADLLRPTFQKTVDALKEKGILATIQESSQDKNQTNPPKITISFHVGSQGGHAAPHYPHFSAVCDSARKVVQLHQSSLVMGRGGQAGVIGQTNIDGLDEQFITQKLLDLLKLILK